MTIQGPDHPTDYRMVKLTDGTLLVGTISTTETELTIENPLQLTTVQRLTEVGMKDDSSLDVKCETLVFIQYKNNMFKW